MSDTSTPPPGAEDEAFSMPVERPDPGSEAAMPEALDADDTRGWHLRRLARSTVTLSVTATAAIVAFVIGTINAGAGVGGIGVGAVLLIALIVIFVIASARAKEDFLRLYASSRGLSRGGKTRLPPVTDLLRRGDDRYAEWTMAGQLPGGLDGRLCHYTYEIETSDSDGNTDTDYYRFTIVATNLPEAAPHVSDLYCQRRSGFRFMDSAEDAFRTKQRMETESEDFDKRYEVFFHPADSRNWLRRLFSPSFILWMNEAPENFAFELSGGGVVFNVTGHLDSAEELDALCRAAAEATERIRAKALEQSPGAAG